MANLLSVKGFQPVNKTGGGGIELWPEIFELAANRSAAKPVAPGRLLKLTGSLSASGRRLVDTCVAADFDNSAAKVLIGSAGILFNSDGQELSVQYLAATTAGLVQGFCDPALIYAAQMSGVPTAYGGSFNASVVGTITNFDPATADTEWPTPIVPDTVNSATYNATATQLGLRCLGSLGVAMNRDTAAAMPGLFQINAAWHAFA